VIQEAQEEQERLEERLRGRSRAGERLATLRAEMHKTMEESAGIYRSEAILEQAATRLRELQERFERVALDDHSHTFNTQLVAILSLLHARHRETIVHSAPTAASRAARTSVATTGAGRRMLPKTPALRRTACASHRPVSVTAGPPSASTEIDVPFVRDGHASRSRAAAGAESDEFGLEVRRGRMGGVDANYAGDNWTGSRTASCMGVWGAAG
jgi:hypothetical protein